jgi:hypothetical protein
VKLLDAQAADLSPAVVDNGDGTFSQALESSGAGVRMTLAAAQAAGLVPAVVDNGDGAFSLKVSRP